MNARTRLTFIRNEGTPAATTDKSIQNLTCNLLPKIVRHDTMEGREFLVVPMVILTEGVHKGSQGPMYYPPDELAKQPVIWNHKPIVVYHPEINGAGVSACDPAILTNRKVGVMMNTRFEQGKLKSEAWLEKDRADKVDERILEAVNNNEMMEVSTGVFVDAESKEGEWKGEEYIGIARNYRPDHLAILPDKIGACSIKDGAGFLRNEEKKDNTLVGAFKRMWQQVVMADNAMSFNSIQDQLRKALWERLGISKDNYSGPYCYVADVYSNFVIYEMDGKLYRLGYSATDTGVTLDDGDPTQVVRVTEYRTVEGAYVGNQDQTKLNNNMKKKLVDAIILLAAGWSESDREHLMAFNEAQLETIQKGLTPKQETAVTTNTATPPAPPAAPAAPPPAPAPASVPAPSPTPAPAAPKIVTLEEYVAAAPPQMREVLTNSVAVYSEEKTKLVDAIMLNKNHSFTKEDLQNRPLGELRSLARLAGFEAPAQTRSANYGGQGNIAVNSDGEEPLAVPTMNFAPAAAK